MPTSDVISLAVRRLLSLERGPIVLAVSGGLDSMVLLHAAAAQPDARGRLMVGTFDHGTGAFARRATRLVEREAGALGLRVSVGRGALAGAGEAAWRDARWAFLRELASDAGGRVATAHTADDQLETIVMRALRGAGARGLAGLAADSPVLRPFLDLSRWQLAAYARRHDVPHLADPSNRSRRYLRNRVRHDLLPAIARARPEFGREMLSLGERAAALRSRMDGLAERFIRPLASGALCVARPQLATYDSEVLCALWPAIAARVGVTLDRRGTVRLAQFTIEGEPGARVQLSGGVEVVRCRDGFVFRHLDRQPDHDVVLPLRGSVAFGQWIFRPITSVDVRSAWCAALPAAASVVVRRWRDGDRMWSDSLGSARRVKRYFSDAHVAGPDRAGWPVVTVDGEIVWIPGIRRSDAATVRSGRPVVGYACERIHG